MWTERRIVHDFPVWKLQKTRRYEKRETQPRKGCAWCVSRCSQRFWYYVVALLSTFRACLDGLLPLLGLCVPLVELSFSLLLETDLQCLTSAFQVREGLV